MKKILISACLLGQKVRYDGKSSPTGSHWLKTWSAEGRLVAICPEVAGGLSVPRPAAEICGGDGDDVLQGRARLKTESGRDVTDAFVAGAEQALKVARREGIKIAILKAKSPSCGSSQIYDGSFSGHRRSGVGVTAAILRNDGIAVFNEDEIDAAAETLTQLR